MISEKLRKVENLHIIFWLVKDTCWCLLSKELGLAMIFPTILIAMWIVIKTRKNLSEFAHNLAVLFWISANSTWMLGEFYCEDCTRPYAIVLFFLGITCLCLYYGYLLQQRFKQKAEEGKSKDT
jgi:hypothetical protein